MFSEVEINGSVRLMKNYPRNVKVLNTYNDWDEVMLKWFSTDIEDICIDKTLEDEMPENIKQRILFQKKIEQLVFETKFHLNEIILGILKDNSYIDDVLNALPGYVTYAEFTSTSFIYRYSTQNNSESPICVIQDPIMGWYVEPGEESSIYKLDEYSAWGKVEAENTATA